jgi:nitroreductase/NAD-dependent dihydropyrimidine dehydrogenase PreA subunit
MTTISVNQDLCTRCGICSVVCPAGIVSPADEDTLPRVADADAGMCMGCGHCESFCPSQALLLNDRPDERVSPPADAGKIAADDLAYYLKKRRSVRHFTKKPVPQETILAVLDIARYAASGGNRQSVGWHIVYNPAKVRRIAELTIDWMRTLLGSPHPLSGYLPVLIAAWEEGRDVICRDAPHLIIPHIPEDNPLEQVNAIIALTYFDISAPAFGIGTCWAGFVAGASREYLPLKKMLNLPEDRIAAYAMMFGHPQYKVYGIPRRKSLQVTWQ